MTNNIVRVLFQNTIFVSSIVLIIILVYPLLKKWFVPRMRCLIWLLLAIRLLLPFEIALIKLPFTMGLPMDHIHLENNDNYIDETIVFSTEENLRNINHPNVSIYDIIAIIWITGVVAYSLFYIIKYKEFKKNTINASYVINDKEMQNLLEGVLLESNLKLRNPITIKGCTMINTPMLMGVIHPILFIPNKDYDNDSLRLIIIHELIHFYNRDILLKYLLLISKIIHWFNPIIHIMTRIANNDIELSCDYHVVKDKDLAFRKLYSDLIISHINISPIDKGILFTNLRGNKTNIKNRINEIFNFKIRKKGNYLLLLFTVIIMLISPNIIESTIKNNGDLELIERVEQYEAELFNELFTNFDINPHDYKIVQPDDKPLYAEITMLFRVDKPIPSSSYGDTKLYYFIDNYEIEGLAMKQDIDGVNYLYRFKADENSRSGWNITDREQVQGEVIFFDDYFIENPAAKPFEMPVD